MSMEMTEAAIKDRLLSSDAEYRRLAMEHRSHSDRLDQLSDKPFLSDTEKLEEVTLKKKKLHLKDQMQSIINHHRRQVMG